jgi:mono/diheme cytochrome c family protein
VILVEARGKARTAVPARAEGDALCGDRRIRSAVVVGRDEGVDVDEVLRLGGKSCSACHASILPGAGPGGGAIE